MAEDIASDELEGRLLDLSDRRMPAGGELCPLDLLPAAGSEPALRELLDRIGLSDRAARLGLLAGRLSLGGVFDLCVQRLGAADVALEAADLLARGADL